MTTEKFRQQLVPKLDVVRAEAQVVEAESLVKESETAYLNLLANLSYIAGGMEVVPMEETLHVPVFDVTPGIQKALEARPDVTSPIAFVSLANRCILLIAVSSISL